MDHRTRILICSLITLAILTTGLFIFSYVPDDTFITLRYARNVLRGEGFVFNAGEKVEGYTNYLWLLVLVFTGKLGAPLVVTARILSFTFSLGTLVLAAVAARANGGAEQRAGSAECHEGPEPALGMFLTPMLLAASPPFLTWCLSGSELPLYTFLLLAGFMLLRTGARPGAAFVVFGLLGLVRPEGTLLYALAFVGILVRSPRKTEVALKGLGIAAVFYAPYLVWKWRYFQAFVPNALYAESGPPGLMLRNGTRYLFGFILSYGYLLVVGLFLLHAAGRKHERLVVPLLLVAACWLGVLVLGGDWMPHYRLLLPTLPLVMLIVSEGVSATARGARASVLALLFVFLAMAPGAVGYDSFLAERVTVRAFALLGQRLREILPPGTSIGCGSTGAIGYYTDMPIVDILGRTERYIARHGQIVATQPGHLKTDGAYVLERKPDLLLFGNVQIHRGEWERDRLRLKAQENETAARTEFSRDYDFVNIPLGNDFYLSCFKRKHFFLPL